MNTGVYFICNILENDSVFRFWVFRSWGRIGTTIGGNKLDNFSNLLDAVRQFKELYLEKTGNHFENRENFVKVRYLIFNNCSYL